MTMKGRLLDHLVGFVIALGLGYGLFKVAIDTRLDGLEAAVTRLDRTCPLTAEVQRLATEVAGTEERLTRRREELASLSERLATRTATVDARLVEHERLASIWQDLEARVEALDAELREAWEEVSAREELLNGLEASVTDLLTRDELPIGTVLAWVPAVGESQPPPGWEVCDGRQGTPDLRGLFLRGVGSADEVAHYVPASQMAPAGLHAHVTEVHRSIDSTLMGNPREPGDGLVLFDDGIRGQDADVLADHGEHVHWDDNVPEHYTVLYIMKLEDAG